MTKKIDRIKLYQWCCNNKANIGAVLITNKWFTYSDYNAIRSNISKHYNYTTLNIFERKADKVKLQLTIIDTSIGS